MMTLTILLQEAATAATAADILKTYLIICICISPISMLLTAVFLYRAAAGRPDGRPVQLPGLRELLAKALPGLAEAVTGRRPDSVPSPAGPAPEAAAGSVQEGREEASADSRKPSPAPPVRRTIYEENAEAGIPNILLRTGDTYRCFMSEAAMREHGQGGWTLDYPFIGRLSQNGRFEALRAGTTYIQCGNSGDIYYMEITPRHSQWPYSVQMSDIANGAVADEIRTKQASGSEVQDGPCARTLTVRDGSRTATYRFDDTGRADLVLVRLPDTDTASMEAEEGLAEYMELTIQKGRTSYWHHRTSRRPGTPDGDSVDTVAFVKHTGRGILYLGIGRCWRPGAGSSEVRANTDMLEAIFGGLMDPADVPLFIGRRSPSHSATPPMAVTAAEQPATDGESGQATADGGAEKKKRQRKSAGTGSPKKAKRKDERPADSIDPTGAFPEDGMNNEPENYDEQI